MGKLGKSESSNRVGYLTLNFIYVVLNAARNGNAAAYSIMIMIWHVDNKEHKIVMYRITNSS